MFSLGSFFACNPRLIGVVRMGNSRNEPHIFQTCLSVRAPQLQKTDTRGRRIELVTLCAGEQWGLVSAYNLPTFLYTVLVHSVYFGARACLRYPSDQA